MKNLFKTAQVKKIGLLILALCFAAALSTTAAVAQQRDPFWKPVVKPKPKKAVTPTPGKTKDPKAGPTVVAAPPIEQRINSYKSVRQRCAELNVACPKPTSVLTLDEMQVVGVFRTPRGYAAMVEATPIKLSYTVYPGEKFFDGQLVAIEETKLVFRRVTRMSDGKEIVGADNKILRQAGINDMAQTRAEAVPASSATSPTANPTVSVPAAQGISAEAVPQNKSAAKTGDGYIASDRTAPATRDAAETAAEDYQADVEKRAEAVKDAVKGKTNSRKPKNKK